MTPLSKKLLESIPSSWDKAESWLEATLVAIQQLTHKQLMAAEFTSLEWLDIAQEPTSPFGLHTSESWRKFVLATFLADTASYPTPTDQVNFDRLLFIMYNFPQGFRTWWVKPQNSPWLPIGYTGWYPMVETAFTTFKATPERLTNRMVLPATQSPFLYLFNFSVAPQAKKLPLTKALMTAYVDNIRQQNPQGLACITVSEDGIRAAKRLGMFYTGSIQTNGSKEDVWISQITS